MDSPNWMQYPVRHVATIVLRLCFGLKIALETISDYLFSKHAIYSCNPPSENPG